MATLREQLVRTAASALAVIVLVTAPGCGGESGPSSNGSSLRTGGTTPTTGNAGGTTTPEARPSGYSMSDSVRAIFRESISVPYDGQTLPLTSPDGRFIATQTGAPPTLDTIIASSNATVPWTTRIEIYDTTRDTIGYIAVVDVPAVLGRSVTNEGFLIEAPREDGSRWIGFAEWESGAVHWLVANDNVNAFASLGPNNQLAWSTRSFPDDSFGLAVATLPAGPLVENQALDVWTIQTLGTDWVLPTWGGRSTGLFATTIRAGAMDVVHGSASDRESFRRSLQRISIASTDGTVWKAYQSVNGMITAPDNIVGPATDQYVFLHLTHYGIGVWRPNTQRRNPLELLERGTWHAVVDSSGNVFSSRTEHRSMGRTIEGLYRSQLYSDQRAIELRSGAMVPRPITDRDWPWLLLAPSGNSIQVTFMSLLPDSLTRASAR